MIKQKKKNILRHCHLCLNTPNSLGSYEYIKRGEESLLSACYLILVKESSLRHRTEKPIVSEKTRPTHSRFPVLLESTFYSLFFIPFYREKQSFVFFKTKIFKERLKIFRKLQSGKINADEPSHSSSAKRSFFYIIYVFISILKICL